jgi:hypothetical protein
VSLVPITLTVVAELVTKVVRAEAFPLKEGYCRIWIAGSNPQALLLQHQEFISTDAECHKSMFYFTLR